MKKHKIKAAAIADLARELFAREIIA